MIFKDLIFYRSPILSHTGYILDTYWIHTGYILDTTWKHNCLAMKNLAGGLLILFWYRLQRRLLLYGHYVSNAVENEH